MKPTWNKVLPIGRILSCLVIIFLVLSCDQQKNTTADTTAAAPLSQKNYDGTIIALGNSLTAGLGVAESEAYPAQLEKKLQQNGYNWQVINAGISGETSSGALARINWIIAQQPDMVILETGANDGMRGIPTDLIEKNLNRMVEQLKEAGIEVVLAGMQMLQNLGPDYTRKFSAVYPSVAQKQNILLVPFFLEQVAGNPGLNLPDTIHPTPAGHAIVAQNVYPYVEKAIRKIKSG